MDYELRISRDQGVSGIGKGGLNGEHASMSGGASGCARLKRRRWSVMSEKCYIAIDMKSFLRQL